MTKTVPELTDDDARYFDRRAELQLKLAQRSSNPTAIAAHCAIADRYMTLRAEAEGSQGLARSPLPADAADGPRASPRPPDCANGFQLAATRRIETHYPLKAGISAG